MEDLSNRTLWVLCVAMTLATTVCAQTEPAINSTNAATQRLGAPRFDLDNQHRIRPGDKLSFRVAEDREEAKALTVTDSGEVELPSPFGRFSRAEKRAKALLQKSKSLWKGITTNTPTFTSASMP